MSIPIVVRGLSKSFDDKVVLKNVDLEIRPHEILTLIGGSGSGKSLLAKSLIGLVRPDSGSILFDGVEVANLSEADWIAHRRRVGVLFQESALFDSMDVRENIAYGLREQGGYSEEEISARVRRSLKSVGLGEIEALYPASLSGGMRKRVALARAIVFEPDMVIYDEPTEGLDPINVTRIGELIRRLRDELDITTLVVTHNMRTAFTISDRVALLADGEIVVTDTPAAVLESQDTRLADFQRAARDPMANAPESRQL